VSSEYPLSLARLTIGRSTEVMSTARSGMSRGILLILILASLLMVLYSSKADAQTVCQAELGDLRTAINSATFVNESDQVKLIAKLDNAESKLSEGKTADAVAKIGDIRSAVAKLADGGKVDDEGARAIDDAAVAAIECLEGTSSV
jgi:hypothetical protein